MSTRIVFLRSALCGFLCAFTWPASPSRADALVRWRSVPTHAAEFGLTAIAFDPASDRIAAGNPRGLYAGDAGGVFDLVVGRSEVRDLAFLRAEVLGTETLETEKLGAEKAAGVLFAATNRGVYRIAAEGRTGPAAPGPGDGARDVFRVAVAPRGAGVAVATAGGAFLSRDGMRWHPLSSTHPAGPVSAIALRERGEGATGFECFTLVRGALWRTVVPAPGVGDAVRTWRETIPFAPTDNALDVVTGLPGLDVVVVYGSALAVRRAGGRVAGESSSVSGQTGSISGKSAWEILRPVLPPGGSIVRIAAALGRFWLATDRGLLEAPSLEGPWRRAGAPAGSAAVRSLAGDAESLYVASATRLLRAEIESEGHAEGTPGAFASASGEEPTIHDLHRAAIAHLSLSRARLGNMQSRVGRRGWFPVVSLRADHDRDRDWGTDRDQTFTYGELHDLVDRGDGHSIGTSVSLTLAWDFGDVVYHPEEIDVSREVRTLLAFRDDVLDELTQLYFDRQRVLVQRAALPSTSAEAQLLQLRAAELEAGMNAWTGGWFSLALGRSLP